jgi:hypothetical protein
MIDVSDMNCNSQSQGIIVLEKRLTRRIRSTRMVLVEMMMIVVDPFGKPVLDMVGDQTGAQAKLRNVGLE